MFTFSIVFICLCVILPVRTESFLLYAPIDSGGIRGNVTFVQEPHSDNVKISIFLTSLLDGAQQFDWAIHEFPVFFDLKNPCQATELGKSVADLSRHHGQITLSSEQQTLQFESNAIQLRGLHTIWGRSLYLKSTNTSARACSNVMTTSKTSTAIARFTQTVAGTILLRENEFSETTIFSNLYYASDRAGTRNDWRIMVTDILDHNTRFKCNQLGILLDPDNVEDEACSTNEQHKCKIGDLTRKHGQILVGKDNNRYSKRFYVDLNLSLEYIESSRKLFVVIYEKNSNKEMACAQIETLHPKEVKTYFNMDGVKGELTMKQNYKIDPTIITVRLDNLRGRGKLYHVHEFPFAQRQSKGDRVCSLESVGNRYNPFGIDNKLETMVGTNDQYGVGDLSGKHGILSEVQDIQTYFNSYLDFNLPLFGIHSIVGRSIVIYGDNGEPWVCANIGYPDRTIVARATFYFPVIGMITFRQQHDDPLGDTVVMGNLFHSESMNLTHNHIWRVHVNQAGPDFYNWTRRCASAGDSYNPYQITTARNYNTMCSHENQLRCHVGDLYLKFRRLSINTYRSRNESTKFFYTDTLLPLSGKESIIAKSIVIEDENAPQIRGKRMACVTIRRHHPTEAIVDQWRTSSGIASNISGSMELIQETEFDETRGKLKLRGLNRLASGFHIHKASVPLDKEFPCSGDTVYGHYNPFDTESQIVPYPSVGSVDEYETGDLSGKFGLLDNLAERTSEFIDSNLPVIGVNSVIGRSLVVHKKDNNFRWSCATIRPKVGKTSREIVSIASFDDPRNLIYGYVRFRQVEYFDGSLSNAWIETYLKHRSTNKKITYGHNWSIFVNSVGADAFNAIDSVRCLAGGFLWNPYLAKIDESYQSDCNPQNGLRCALGDLSGRNGPLAIGGDRQIYSDTSLPFTGNFSAMNRALIISMQNGSTTALACANIKLDKHLISNIVIQKIPAFTVAKFMSHMRTLLNAADWLVVAEVQKAKELSNNECIQILVHFYGDEAWRLQSEFNNLIEFGSIRKGGDLTKTYYKSCKSVQSNSTPMLSCSPITLILLLLTSSTLYLSVI
ncbi:hypothetical protein BLOT_007628 [Blomia tropicalis]|nr:hypothetical protein BLOT_007628 [Blomia tropicalis]